MTGSSGRRRRRAGSRTAGRAGEGRPRDSSRPAALDGRHAAVQIGPEGGEVGCCGGWQRPEYHEARAEPGELGPDRRTQPTLDAVPDHGVADSPAHHHAHPGRFAAAPGRGVHDDGTARRTPSAHRGSELLRAAHPVDLGKHATPVVRRRDEYGPCGAGRRGSTCRRACASAAGTRASCYAGGCSVETYAYSRGQAPIFTVDRHGGRMVRWCVAACCGRPRRPPRTVLHDTRGHVRPAPTPGRLPNGTRRVHEGQTGTRMLVHRSDPLRRATRREDSPRSEVSCASPVENVLSCTRSCC
jgi:hypothetical protein